MMSHLSDPEHPFGCVCYDCDPDDALDLRPLIDPLDTRPIDTITVQRGLL